MQSCHDANTFATMQNNRPANMNYNTRHSGGISSHHHTNSVQYPQGNISQKSGFGRKSSKQLILNSGNGQNLASTQNVMELQRGCGF